MAYRTLLSATCEYIRVVKENNSSESAEHEEGEMVALCGRRLLWEVVKLTAASGDAIQ